MRLHATRLQTHEIEKSALLPTPVYEPVGRGRGGKSGQGARPSPRGRMPQADRPAGRDRQCGGLFRLGRRELRSEFEREIKVGLKTNLKPFAALQELSVRERLMRAAAKTTRGPAL